MRVPLAFSSLSVQLTEDFSSVCNVLSTVLAAAETEGREGVLATLKHSVKFREKALMPLLPCPGRPWGRDPSGPLQLPHMTSDQGALHASLPPLVPASVRDPGSPFSQPSHLALCSMAYRPSPALQDPNNSQPAAISLEGN